MIEKMREVTHDDFFQGTIAGMIAMGIMWILSYAIL